MSNMSFQSQDVSKQRVRINIELFLYQKLYLQQKNVNISKWVRGEIDKLIDRDKNLETAPKRI